MGLKRNIAAFGICILAAFIVFGKSIPYEFLIWDDGAFITHNELIKSLSPGNIFSMFTDTETSIVVPFTWISLAIDYKIFGMNAEGFSITNICFHGINIFLVYFIFQYFVRRKPHATDTFWLIALISAIIWGLHPLRVESVVWISQRRDVLSVFFCLLSVYFYLRYARCMASKDYFMKSDEKAKPWDKHLSFIFFLMALGSKPTIVPLPVVLILIDIFPLRRIDFNKNFIRNSMSLVSEKWLFFSMSALFAFLTIFYHGANDALKSITSFPFEHRFTNAVYSVSLYARNTLLPMDLLPFYVRQSLDYLNALVIASLAFHAAIIFYSIRLAIRKSQYWAITSYAVFIIILFPILGFFQGGQQGAGDRFTYTATLPFFYIIGWALLHSRYRKPIWIIGSLWFAALTAQTIKVQEIWESNESFLTIMNAEHPNTFASNHNKLGLTYAHQNKWEEARKQFHMALESPGDDVMFAGAAYGLARTYQELDNFSSAELYYKKAIEFDPVYTDAFADLGKLYMDNNRFSQSIAPLEKAVSLNNNIPENMFSLGTAYLLNKEYEKAASQLERVTRLKPEMKNAHLNLGYAYLERGMTNEALRAYNTELKYYPKSDLVYQHLGKLYLNQGKIKEAEAMLNNSLKFNPDNINSSSLLNEIKKNSSTKESELK